MRILRNTIVCLGLIMVWGCQFKSDNNADKDRLVRDSLMNFYADSMVENPLKVIDIFNDACRQMQDSIMIYGLKTGVSQCYFYGNQMAKAMEVNQDILDFCLRAPASPLLSELLAATYNSRGAFFTDQSEQDSAIVCFQAAINALQTAGKRTLLPSVLINLADSYSQKGDFSLSGLHYRKALMAADSVGTKERDEYVIYSGLARLYVYLDNYEEADFYYKQAEQLVDNTTPYEQYYFANNRGNYYYNTKEYDQALYWFRKADRITDAFEQQGYKGIIWGNMGEIFLLKKETDSARYYLKASQKAFGKTYFQPALKFSVDGLFAALALQENNLPEAERLLSETYDMQQINPLYAYHKNHRLEELYQKKGDYKKAYQYRKMADAINDSLRNAKVKNSIAEIDFRYRQDTTLLKKNIQLISVQEEVSQWKFVAMIGLWGVTLLALGGGCWIIYRRRKREQQYQKQLASVTSLRMAVVRNRISPHFIFNALNVILPMFREYEALDKPMRLLIKVLRGNLVFSEKLAVSLNEEIRFVKDFLELKMVGSPDMMRVEWDLSPNVPDTLLLPSMCIQIPVENAIKYAFSANDSDAYIRIRTNVEGEFVWITIEDNGSGIEREVYWHSEKGTGSGLKILYQTIELLNTKNKEKISFTIQNRRFIRQDEHGTLVTVKVPIHYTFEL